MSAIDHATVAILSSDGELQGTGFLVGPRHVLTCAHVVGDALGDRGKIATSDEKPEGKIQVRFTVADKPSKIDAKVAEQGWSRFFHRSDLNSVAPERFTTRDLALLQLKHPPMTDASPVRFWRPCPETNFEQILERNTLVAAGYPRVGQDAFKSLTFRYKSLTDGNELMFSQVGPTTFDADDLAGLSGAALVLKEYQMVIGMILEVESGENHIVVKPATHLVRFWDQLRTVCHGNEISPLAKIPFRRLLDIDREPQRKAVVKAACTASRDQSRMLLAAIAGESDNSISEWIDHVIVEQVQYELDDPLPDLVEAIKPIIVYGRRLSAEALFKMALKKLAERLGIRYQGDFLTEVRHALNGDRLADGSITEPPPYLIFQLTARKFSDLERHVLARLVQFWCDVAEGGLERTQLIFFALITDDAQQELQTVTMQQVLEIVLETASGQNAVRIFEVLHNNRYSDVQQWIERCTEEPDAEWELDANTAKRIQRVVRDIFDYEVESVEISLRTFQKELEKLDLFQQQQEG